MSKINAEVNSLDVRGLLERVDRARYEVLKSGSSNFDDIRTADRERIDTYNAEIISYANYIAAEPEQDYPESYPGDVHSQVHGYRGYDGSREPWPARPRCAVREG
jgi:hypothetical protein